MLPIDEEEQNKIRFDNMMGNDQGGWSLCSKDKDGKMYLSVNTVVHFLYIYGTFDIESCTIGENKVNYWGEEICTFEMSEKYKIPVFKFVEKYKWVEDNQTIFLDGIDKGSNIKWRENFSHLKSLIKINF